jgi:hypothetical protein
LDLTVENIGDGTADLDIEIRALYADLEDHALQHPEDDDAAQYLQLWRDRPRFEAPLTPEGLQYHLGAIGPCDLRTVPRPETEVFAGAKSVINVGRRDQARMKKPGGDLLLLWSLAQRMCHATNTDFVAASEVLSRSLLTRKGE